MTSSKRKILVTGAGGYIGSVATDLFLKKEFEVVGMDNFSTGYRQPLELLQKKFGARSFRFYEADLRDDLSPILKKEKGIEAVVHYAASCSVNESMQEPLKYFGNNVCGSQNLFRQMLEYGIKNLVFSSTAAVYGEAKYLPIDERHPTNPTSIYGESKVMIEKMIQWLGKLKDLHYVILRYFNVSGASDDSLFGYSKKPVTHLVDNAVRGALGIAPFSLTCPKVRTEDGTPIRDYANVVDLNEAHYLALNYLFSGGKGEVINLGTGTGNSVLEIVSAVQKVTGKKLALGKSAPRQGEWAKAVASIEKAKKILGWQPKRSLEQSIRSLTAWYQNRPQGWEY